MEAPPKFGDTLNYESYFHFKSLRFSRLHIVQKVIGYTYLDWPLQKQHQHRASPSNTKHDCFRNAHLLWNYLRNEIFKLIGM